MNRAQRLQEILKTAARQRELLRSGDLAGVERLQRERQELLGGLQISDGLSEDEKSTVSQLLALDREMRWLLGSRQGEIQEKLHKIQTLRKLLRSDQPSRGRSRERLSFRV
jgi:5-methylcytosine-specific restriction endonuclease McrBC GTP-binding regulatory subunit McrB